MQSKKYTLLWFTAGLLLSLMAFVVIWTGLTGMVWIPDPESIPEAADTVMNSIHTGDWTALENMTVGKPALAPASGEQDSPEALIWEAYLESLQWKCSKEFDVQGSSVAQEIAVTCLDIPGITNIIADILSDSDTDQTDAEKQAQLLQSATKQALEFEPPVIQYEITLTFQRKDEQWLLVPNRALQMLLSGFTLQ